MSRLPLALKVAFLHVVLLGGVLALVWWSLQAQAADYFMQLMKKYKVEPTEVHEMFLAANLRTLLGVGLSGAALAGLCAVLLTRRWLAPLAPMRVAAGRIASGDYTARTGVQSRDELGALAGNFDAMAASLERLDQVRERLVVDAAHELRTPLTNLRGYLEALVDGVVPATPATFELLHGECLRLIRLSEALLAAARQGQKMAPRREAVPFAEFLATRLAVFEPRVESQGLELRTEIGACRTLAADPDQLRSIVDNLIQNALQFTPRGGVITVRAFTKGDEQRLMVGNSGPGISAEDLPHIFEPYFRGDASRTRRAGGGSAGLGLAIVKACVESHGGRVEISSGPDVTRVFVHLPAGSEVAASEHAENMPRPIRRAAGQT